MSKRVRIKWCKSPAAHDYPSALSYLLLLCDEKTAAAHVRRLKRAAGMEFKAKDIFRASGLSLLGVSDRHIARDQRLIKAGRALSPLLLVRDTVHSRVIVADGYHRLCAVYARDEDALIPCRIV